MYTEQLKSGHYRHQMTFVEERTGKKRRVSTTTEKNTEKARREAEKILNEKIRAINVGFVHEDETLRQAFDAWLADGEKRWRPSTARRNACNAGTLCNILRPDTLVSRLTARYVAECLNASGKGPTTLNGLLERLKWFLSWCWETERLQDISWTARLHPWKEPTSKEKNEMKYLERDELAQLLPELKIDLNRYLIHFLALSGLRIGEALCLHQEDVDLDARLIHVTKTVDHPTGEELEGAKTDNSTRDVYIQDELLQLCKEIRAYMHRMAMACGFRSDLFFCDFSGEPLKYARIHKYFAENTERVIGRRLTLHSLRHTHASLMFEGGATLEAVALRLGHKGTGMLLQIYLHITKRLKERYNQQFDAIRIL